jgi:putative zinc finger/helix-turn-helix YgiT family protein
MEQNWTCSNCGKPARLTNGSYHYEDIGLDDVTLEGIDLIHCDHCGNEDPIIPSIERVHDAIAHAVISKPGRLTGKQIRFLRKYLGMNGRSAAAALQVHPTTLSKWENGDDPIGPQSDSLLRALVSVSRKEQLQEVLQHLNAVSSDEESRDIVVDVHSFEPAAA